MQNEDNKNFTVTIKECFCFVKGKFVIAVNGNEKVDLENTHLYQKASWLSLTYVKTIL